MIDNAEWLTKLNYIDFLRDVGRHFSVNRMLSMDSVKMRLERDQELSFIEFNYMCLQAYDFVELNRRYGCMLQMGGSDQWGNIVTGIDLGRRMGTPQLYALTAPLLTTASGAKMGKTAAGAVWLNADMLSPYDYWQFWRNTEDARRRPLPEAVHDCCRWTRSRGSKRSAAPRSTRRRRSWPPRRPRCCTGATAAEAAAETARKTFEEGVVGRKPAERRRAVGARPIGMGVLSAFVRAGLVASTGEARRQIKGGGLRLNDAPVSDERAALAEADFRDGVAKLSLGKKKHVLLRAE